MKKTLGYGIKFDDETLGEAFKSHNEGKLYKTKKEVENVVRNFKELKMKMFKVTINLEIVK